MEQRIVKNWLTSERKRRKIPWLIARYGDECFYCGVTFTETGKRARTLDHMIPLSRGGTNHKINLVLCCSRCNGLKGDQTVEEFAEQAASRRAVIAAEEARKQAS